MRDLIFNYFQNSNKNERQRREAIDVRTRTVEQNRDRKREKEEKKKTNEESKLRACFHSVDRIVVYFFLYVYGSSASDSVE